MAEKLLVPVIFLKDGAAVTSEEDVTAILDTDPVRLALRYAEDGADAILACDLSVTDREHEEALALIQQICASVKVPVYGQGHIRRMEDVKKLLYAGCRKAVLDFDRIDHETMYREVADKFGADRIVASISATRLSRSSILKVEEAGSWLMLRDDAAIAFLRAPSPEKFFGSIPLIIDLKAVNLEQILELFRKNVVALTGNCINENSRNLGSIRQMLQDNGIAPYPFHALTRIRFDDLKKGADQLVPVVVQEAATDEVLMVAYMDRTAFDETLRTGRMTYYSRSRKQLWVKGETSGHYQYLISLTADCDMDTLLAKVRQIGAACHTGSHSCFFNSIYKDENQEIHNPSTVLLDDYKTIIDRREHPKEGSYTTYLFEKGIDKMLKKLGEENAEIIIAAKNPDSREIIYEIADYLYHMMVVMANQDVTWEDVFDELARRQNSEQSRE